MFETFYAAYPRKEKRMDAEKAFRKLPKDVTVEMLITSVDNHIKTVWRGRERRFVPLPATYLRGMLWLDELDGSEVKDPKQMAPQTARFAFTADDWERCDQDVKQMRGDGL